MISPISQIEPPRPSAGEARIHHGPGPRWEFFSPRLQCQVGGSGNLRLDHFVQVECDPDVTSYEPFPTLIASVHGGTENRIVADTLVRYRDGRKVVNTLSELREPASCTNQLYLIERAWAEKNGCKHATLNMEDIRRDDKHLSNCYTIFPWLSELHEPTPQETQAVIGAVMLQTAAISLSRLAQLTECAPATTVAIVARAYVRRIVAIEDFRAKKFAYDSLVAAVKNS